MSRFLLLDRLYTYNYSYGMTYREATATIDKYRDGAWLRTTEGLLVAVSVGDVRQVFGRTDLQVSAEGGTSAWVASDRVELPL